MSQPRFPERFHIHIDAEWIDPCLSKELLEAYGFSEKNFVREGRRGSEFSPHVHITRKYPDRVSFDRDFDFILREIGEGRSLEGYVEGEFIALNRSFSTSRRSGSTRLPFIVEVAPLAPGSFRQTELHLTVSSAESDPEVLDTLFEMGFFCAYAPKDYGMAQVFTMQGSYRNIAVITPLLIGFIEQGGLARARLKEERIVRWWTSSATCALPPVVARIEQFPDRTATAQPLLAGHHSST